MISTILDTIKGKIKFAINLKHRFYFVGEFAAESGGGFYILDELTQSRIFISDNEFQELNIITWGENTIPSQPEIEMINNENNSFFTDNEAEHTQNNLRYDELLNNCKEYYTHFDSENRCDIAGCVIEGNTTSLDRLKILGIKEAFIFDHATFMQQSAVRDAYFNLINTKLEEALKEINENILEMDDEEFKTEALLIAKDLEDNVDIFRLHMQGVKFDRLFNQWPTLLNPSPFNNDV